GGRDPTRRHSGWWQRREGGGGGAVGRVLRVLRRPRRLPLEGRLRLVDCCHALSKADNHCKGEGASWRIQSPRSRSSPDLRQTTPRRSYSSRRSTACATFGPAKRSTSQSARSSPEVTPAEVSTSPSSTTRAS